jgi:CelD/BcsL family acetyltransferase involved in cellulose biosynthesis
MTDWDRLVGTPLAPYTDPFPNRAFLEIVAEYGPAQPEVLATGDASVAVVVADGTARLAGEHHLTDYHSPLGSDIDQLAHAMSGLDAEHLDLDSLPAEAATVLESGLTAAGRSVIRHDDEPTRFIDLTIAESEDWESILRSKERHEVRRKRRRYEASLGEPELSEGRDYFDQFVALHRSAMGDKGGFMTEEMEAFFAALLELPETRLDVLLAPDGVGAAAFGFEHARGYSLYNSAYDAALSEVSPGIVLTDRLIARSLHAGQERFDFLKGDEVYKRRLGAVERPLVRLTVDL